jgi:hypothetical protein
MRRWSLSLPHLEAVASGPCHLSDRRLTEPTEDHHQGRLSVCVYLVALTVRGWGSQTVLTVILVGFNNDGAGRMARPHTRSGWRCPAGTVRCPGVRASAAAAARFRAKASGRCVVRWVPAGVSCPPSALRQLSRLVACAVTCRQARGALGAPLKK